MNDIKTLEEIKNKLFKEVYDAYISYEKILRRNDVFVNQACMRYCTLYDFMANELGLETEYLEFRERMEGEE